MREEVDRTKFIGSTDSAPILGHKSFGRTKLDVWLEKKKGIQRQFDRETKFLMDKGKALEPVVLKNAIDMYELSVIKTNERYFHKKYEFISAEIDAETREFNVEIKCSQTKKGWDIEGEKIPDNYYIQVQHGLMVTGKDLCKVFVSFFGALPKKFEIPRDNILISKIEEEECEFWEKNVLGGEIPNLMPGDAIKIYPEAIEGSSIHADAVITNKLSCMRELHKEMKKYEKKIEKKKEEFKELADHVQIFMKDAEVLYEGDRVASTWKFRNQALKTYLVKLKNEFPEAYKECVAIQPQKRYFVLKNIIEEEKE